MPDLSDAHFWMAVLQIIAIDLVLSGDNAVVIALACRNLAPEQKRRGVLWGVAGAVGLRVVLTAFAASLMNYPYLRLVGALLLLWIGVKLLMPDDAEGHDIDAAGHLWGAVKTIIVADFVMSLDNVVAVAGAAHGSVFLLLFGLAVSIPLIVWSSQLVMKLMERHPLLILLGAGLLGWVAGSMLVSDAAVQTWVSATLPPARWLAPPLGAMLVVAAGLLLARRRRATDYPLE